MTHLDRFKADLDPELELDDPTAELSFRFLDAGEPSSSS
jgi:hypothetical protein